MTSPAAPATPAAPAVSLTSAPSDTVPPSTAAAVASGSGPGSAAAPKTLFYGAATLDGFLATRDDGLEWLLQFGTAVASYEPFIAGVGALAMGAATYEWLLRHHVRPGTPEAQPWPYAQPTWVFTRRTLPRVSGADIRFARGEVAPVHAAMRAAAGGKNLWIVGGGELLGQFHDAGLLDELIVQLAPVTLGAGKPLLPRALHTPPLRLLSVRQYGDTFAELRYAVPQGRPA